MSHLPAIAIILIAGPLAYRTIRNAVKDALPLIEQLNRQWKEWDA